MCVELASQSLEYDEHRCHRHDLTWRSRSLRCGACRADSDSAPSRQAMHIGTGVCWIRGLGGLLWAIVGRRPCGLGPAFPTPLLRVSAGVPKPAVRAGSAGRGPAVGGDPCSGGESGVHETGLTSENSRELSSRMDGAREVFTASVDTWGCAPPEADRRLGGAYETASHDGAGRSRSGRWSVGLLCADL